MGITKHDIVQYVAKQTNLSERKTAKVIQAFLDEMAYIIVEHDRLEFRNFGVFEVVEHKGKTIHHPVTGEPIVVPDYRTVHFKASKTIKDKLNEA